ncbi:MAG: hypothetical protein GYA23_09515, partial [Methanomicrobiales archaeon]|nr:hypothetical protein [Methanomicrobiales archaeon]
PLGLADGIYTVYAVTRPVSQKDLVEGVFNSTSVILQKSIMLTEVSPVSVRRGERFFVTGQSPDFPLDDAVQVWIIGKNFIWNATTPVGRDAKFSQKIDTKTSEDLPEGQCWIIVQHPKAHDLNIVIGDDWVRLRPYQGDEQALFRIRGPGSLQGRDAKDALLAAFDDPAVDDAYVIIPLLVNKTQITAYALADEPAAPVASQAPPAPEGGEPALQAATTAHPETPAAAVPVQPQNTDPVPVKTKAAMVPYAAIIASVLGCGIFVKSRKFKIKIF